MRLRSLFKREPRQYRVYHGTIHKANPCGSDDWVAWRGFSTLKLAMRYALDDKDSWYDRWVVRVFPDGRERLEWVVWSLS